MYVATNDRIVAVMHAFPGLIPRIQRVLVSPVHAGHGFCFNRSRSLLKSRKGIRGERRGQTIRWAVEHLFQGILAVLESGVRVSCPPGNEWCLPPESVNQSRFLIKDNTFPACDAVARGATFIVGNRALNLAQILDTSARILASAACLNHGPSPIPDPALHAYWVYSRDLSHRWMQSLAVCQKVLEGGNLPRSRQCWLEYEPDIREILRADILQRVWYAILLSTDQFRGDCHAEPIARSALAAQMQTRVRALKLVLVGHRFDAARMKSLNQLRRTAETWSDFLCAHLAYRHNCTDILFQPERAEKWCREPVSQLMPELRIPGQPTTLDELQRVLLHSTSVDFPLGPLPRLTRTILDCFPPGTFDDHSATRYQA